VHRFSTSIHNLAKTFIYKNSSHVAELLGSFSCYADRPTHAQIPVGRRQQIIKNTYFLEIISITDTKFQPQSNNYFWCEILYQIATRLARLFGQIRLPRNKTRPLRALHKYGRLELKANCCSHHTMGSSPYLLD